MSILNIQKTRTRKWKLKFWMPWMLLDWWNREALQRIFSFINKCQNFNDIVLCDLQIDGMIYKNGSDKNASLVFRNNDFLNAISPDNKANITVRSRYIYTTVSSSLNKLLLPLAIQRLQRDSLSIILISKIQSIHQSYIILKLLQSRQ